MGEFSTPLQARSQATLERILDAMEDLLRERPLANISVTDLCNLAEVSSSSLYLRFRTKEAMLSAVAERLDGYRSQTIAQGMSLFFNEDGVVTDIDWEKVVELLLRYWRQYGILERRVFEVPSVGSKSIPSVRKLEDSVSGILADLYGLDGAQSRDRLLFLIRTVLEVVERHVLESEEGNKRGVHSPNFVRHTALLISRFLAFEQQEMLDPKSGYLRPVLAS